MFGTSTVSIWALVIIALPYIGLTTMYLKKLVDKTYQSGGKVQAQRVFEQIQQNVDGRLNQLRDHILKEMNPDDLWDEVSQLLKASQATQEGVYLPYQELIKRLEHMQSRKKNRQPVPVTE